MPSAMPASLESATSRPDSVVHETNNGVLGISSRMRLRISIAERTSPTETACNQIAPGASAVSGAKTRSVRSAYVCTHGFEDPREDIQ